MSDKSNGKKTGTAAMSDEHKAALAVGRRQGRAVKAYLEALAANKPKRGRKRTAETIRRRLDEIDAEVDDAAPLNKLQMVQERMDLEAELADMQETNDIGPLEEEFVAVAADYGARKGISYSAWRAVGVEASVLSRAGVSRSRP